MAGIIGMLDAMDYAQNAPWEGVFREATVMKHGLKREIFLRTAGYRAMRDDQFNPKWRHFYCINTPYSGALGSEAVQKLQIVSEIQTKILAARNGANRFLMLKDVKPTVVSILPNLSISNTSLPVSLNTEIVSTEANNIEDCSKSLDTGKVETEVKNQTVAYEKVVAQNDASIRNSTVPSAKIEAHSTEKSLTPVVDMAHSTEKSPAPVVNTFFTSPSKPSAHSTEKSHTSVVDKFFTSPSKPSDEKCSTSVLDKFFATPSKPATRGTISSCNMWARKEQTPLKSGSESKVVSIDKIIESSEPESSIDPISTESTWNQSLHDDFHLDLDELLSIEKAFNEANDFKNRIVIPSNLDAHVSTNVLNETENFVDLNPHNANLIDSGDIIGAYSISDPTISLNSEHDAIISTQGNETHDFIVEEMQGECSASSNKIISVLERPVKQQQQNSSKKLKEKVKKNLFHDEIELLFGVDKPKLKIIKQTKKSNKNETADRVDCAVKRTVNSKTKSNAAVKRKRIA